MTKTKIIIGLVLLSAAFVAGRQSIQATQDVKTNTTQDNEHIAEVVQVHTVTTTTREPNGAEETTVTSDTTAKVKVKDTETSTTKEVDAPKTKGINASVMVATDLHNLSSPLVYGVAVNKQVLGPFTIGVFGLTNSTVGVTVGVSF